MPGEAINGLLDRLAQRGVGVHVAGDLVDPEVPQLGQGQFRQQFGDFGSDEVGAEQLAVGVVLLRQNSSIMMAPGSVSSTPVLSSP